ncbi:exodeoxyribonuclease V subunit gamma [Vibrio algarum]|uniref:RecBCD enzyme subunit RecC n=1 Tax=Vibrio algarum TaxID=3020714 RepID=A0ABT4YP45_9VIBR|nr:exodeoxyribonuclease V subunit gamma [Vibrio sp. KJ40-1]MDB1123167.1 exodeoxyribonuclease V subunit gamma [Vibrio sp. KJ40-1]
MFTVYHSNQIDVLKSLLAELIRANPLENPFDKEQILVQSPGMSQWLKIELAKELGVAANIDFPLPATFIWNMFVQVLDEVPNKSAFNKESMTWKIMQVLPGLLKSPDFIQLRSYLIDDADQSKLYQLSEKIADIFDGYLVYRPEWIAMWEQDKDVAELEGEQPWQKVLWQALYDHTVALNQSPYHRANLYEHFIDTLDHYTGQLDSMPKRLFVFGISSIPPRYMDALAALGQHMDVHLMFTNPSRYYWGEVRDRKYLAKLAMKNRQHIAWKENRESDKLYELDGESAQFKQPIEYDPLESLHTEVVGNSLLASMGKLGRDNMYLLSQLSSNEIEAFVEVKRDNLLHQIQADMLNLEERQDDQNLLSSHHKKQIDKHDSSVSLHACHSPMREVEVLHDRLLEMFEDNPELKPRNIIVMVADINAYSAAIQAVFGNAPGKRYIPFSISDRSASQESPILNAFTRLLTLPDSRCGASEILELLETPEILSRFSLSDKEFEKGKRWVEETGIRWGLDNTTGAEFNLPETNQNTWLFGIQRMLLGYAMHDSIDVYHTSNQSFAPYNEVQGMDAEIAGKFAHFIDCITSYRRELTLTQSVDEWQELLYRLIDDFFLVDLEGEIALKSIRDALQQLSAQLTDAAYSHNLSPAIVVEYLQSKLSTSRVSQRFLAGQVNFCTLMPMRSIPFDVVCLLGMNDGVYPRAMPQDGLDLMNRRARAGDRSRRDDDRYLFLEALLSAQSKLYISYVGRSIQDNSERSPSILVSELLDYCGQNFCLVDDQDVNSDDSARALINKLSSHYPMAPFSQKAFGYEYRSYASEWLPSVKREGLKAEPFIQPLPDYREITDQPEQLPLVELQRFWRLPVKYFFNRRLKVFFEDFGSVTEDDEPFLLNNLQSFHLRDELLHSLLAAKLSHQDEQAVYQNFVQQQRAKGGLPVGAFGELELSVNKEKINTLVDELQFLCQKPLGDIEIDLQITLADWKEPINLSGWLAGNYQSGLVRYRSGRIRSQDLLLAWIDHLCLAVVGESNKTHLVGFNDKAGLEHKVILPIEKEQAQLWLVELVQYYFKGLNQPLTYFPKTALVGMERLALGKEDGDVKMANTFNDGYQFSGEGSNRYIHRVWPEWNEDLSQQTSLVARDVLLALLRQTKDSDNIEI